MTEQGMDFLGMAGFGSAGFDRARRGMERQCAARKFLVRCGKAGSGLVWLGEVGQGKVIYIAV